MKDILALGEINAELVLAGLASPPEFGREVLAEDMALVMGGSTANTACVCATLGMDAAFVGMIGQDQYGEMVSRMLKSCGVDLSYVVTGPEVVTGITVSVSTSSDRMMITWPGDSISGLSADSVDLDAMPARHLHVGGYALQERLKGGLAALFERAHARGMTTSLDTGWDESGRWIANPDCLLAATTYFFPNEQEACTIAGMDDPVAAAAELSRTGATVVAKLGGEGSCAAAGGEIICRAKGYRVTPVDTTGAGDSFNAGFLYAALKGYDIETCLKYGNASGAISVTRVGGATSSPSIEDILHMINKQEEKP